MDFDKMLIRASAVGQVMTGTGKGWTVSESKTCMDYLRMMVREKRWGRQYEVDSKYLRKGNAAEENSLTLLSLEKRIFFKKNDRRIENSHLSGEPDAFVGKDIMQADEGYDVKSSWSWETHPFDNDKLDSDYLYQAHSYMALTGAKRWHIAHRLVNTPSTLIQNEKKKVYFEMDCPDENDPHYKEKCIEIEKSCIYDLVQFQKDYPGFDLDSTDWKFDIPRSERIRIVTVERDEAMIQKIYARIDECRAWMKKQFGHFNVIEAAIEQVPSIPNDQKAEIVAVPEEPPTKLKSLPPLNVPEDKKQDAQKRIKSMKKVKHIKVDE